MMRFQRKGVFSLWFKYGNNIPPEQTNALGEKDSLVTPHSVYLRLGGTKTQRQIVYKDLFKEPLGENLITEIRQTTQTGTPLGGEKFRQQIEELLGVKTGYAKRGRPKSS